MSTDLAEPPAAAGLDGAPSARSSLPNDAPVGLYRPVTTDRGAGRWLRSVVGVKEDILDWVPEERPRYTRLGAIVLNTGLMAGLSLVVALSSVTNGAWWALLPVGLLWAYMILTFDGWLISSTHGVQRTSKLALFLPRIVISLLLGAAIAEPLVLWVFQPSVHNEIDEYRKSAVEDYESKLRSCNPAFGAVSADPSCRGFQLTIKDSPGAIETRLASETSLLDRTTEQVAAMDRHYAQLDRVARAECTGATGPGLTGVPGVGGECRRNREKADQYRLDVRLDQRHAELNALEASVVDLTAKLAQARQVAGRQVSDAIAAKVREKRENLADVGLLDEIHALERLTDTSTVIAVAGWVLRLLLIAIDCLPVLSKMMGGTTCYDTLVTRQLESAKRLHSKHVHLYERQDSVNLDILAQRAERKLRNKTDAMDTEERVERAVRRKQRAEQIDRLAAELEGRDRHTVGAHS
ncbi:DUF4407 domain-containing protein [Actinophytocola glycyrrhizae]|uniref:DUF4407 domain-containing protein n=1 Tax=Actinophytocola glycyrrhizae TaxID=2044873 RepID=A0ABV9S1S1_9PSEU